MQSPICAVCKRAIKDRSYCDVQRKGDPHIQQAHILCALQLLDATIEKSEPLPVEELIDTNFAPC